MADQGKWFKLWVSALFDADLENLTIEQWFRWVRIGTYIKCYGTDGSLEISPPATVLQNILRVTSFDALMDAVKALPKCAIEERKSVTTDRRHNDKTFIVTIENWRKYQVDSSAYRTRKYRDKKRSNVTVQEEKRREVEEKRRDPKPPVPSASPTSPAAEPATARANGLQPAGQIVSTLKINGKPYVPEPEIPESKRMSAEEMRAIRLANMNQAKATPGATPGGDDDVF